MTTAERCRVVLTTPFPDIHLEARHEWPPNSGDDPARFAQDCDAWADYIDRAFPVHQIALVRGGPLFGGGVDGAPLRPARGLLPAARLTPARRGPA